MPREIKLSKTTSRSESSENGVPLVQIDLEQAEAQAKALGLSLEDYCKRLGIPKDKLFAASLEGQDLEVQSDKTGRVKNIILPSGWDADRGIYALQAAKEAEQKQINFNRSFKCIPVDGMVALARAMKIELGFTSLAGQKTFFGEQPPIMVQVKTSKDTSEQVPYCKILPPAWDGGFLQPIITSADSFAVAGVVKKKFEDQVNRVLARVEELLQNESIYKGKAVTLDFSWKENGDGYNPELHAPSFMDVEGVNVDDLILNKEVQLRLENEVWNRITQSDACLENGLSLKHGLLLSGPFGTGKTLSARTTAHLCEKNGWTFLYLKQPSELVDVLDLAKQYSPAVVFSED